MTIPSKINSVISKLGVYYDIAGRNLLVNDAQVNGIESFADLQSKINEKIGAGSTALVQNLIYGDEGQVITNEEQFLTAVGDKPDGFLYVQPKSIVGTLDGNNTTGIPFEQFADFVVDQGADHLSMHARDTFPMELFLKAIPAHEMSLCVPHLDVTVFLNNAPISDSGRLQGFSLPRFLLGNDTIKDGTVDSLIVKAVPDKLTKTLTGEKDLSVLGMEAFLSPQTMVPADEYYNGTGGHRIAPIRDPFRPFLSLNSFSVNIVPSGPLLSYRTAGLSLTLHDHTRLGEIALLIKPDFYQGTSLLVEYGWSSMHDIDVTHDSIYSEFISQLKKREVFNIKNSSFSFNEDGSVTIDLELYAAGYHQLFNGADISMPVIVKKGETNKNPRQVVTDILEKISKLSNGVKLPSLNNGTVQRGLRSVESAMAIDPETQGKIRKAAKNLSKSNPSLALALYDLVGKKKNTKKNKINDLKTYIQNGVKTKIQLLKKLSETSGSKSKRIKPNDPYFPLTKVLPTRVKSELNLYASLGLIMNVFLKSTLLGSVDFDSDYAQIQMVYHPVNRKAGFLYDKSLCHFPIRIPDLEKELLQYSKDKININIAEFITFINGRFISNLGAHAYGFTGIYEPLSKSNKASKEQIDKKGKVVKKYSNDADALKTQVDKVLEQAYPAGSDDLEFVIPRIGFVTEVVPVVVDNKLSSKKIVRLHMFDRTHVNNPAISTLYARSRDGDIASISKKLFSSNRSGQISYEFEQQLRSGKFVTDNSNNIEFIGTVNELKKIMRASYPVIDYLTENSNIISLGISSQNSPELSTVQMMRSGLKRSTEPIGLNEDGMPIQIIPVSLDIELLGFPYAEIGQAFFVDMGTNTSLDNLYVITSVEHTISQGVFTTSIGFKYIDGYGKYRSMTSLAKKLIKKLDSLSDNIV